MEMLRYQEAGVFGILGGGQFPSTTEASQLQCCIHLPEGYRVDIQPLFSMQVEQRGAGDKRHSVSRGWPFWDKLQPFYPHGVAMSVVVRAAPFRVEGYLVKDEPDVNVMVPEPRNAEDERVVAKPCNEEEGIFHVVSDLKLGADVEGNHAGCYRPSVYHF